MTERVIAIRPDPSQVTQTRIGSIEFALMLASDWQESISEWILRTFGGPIDPHERAMRFLEEALELAQTQLSYDEAARILNHVWNKPAGDPPQEVGGVGVTLLALCESLDLNMNGCIDNERRRILSLPPEKFRNRQKRNIAEGIGTTSEKLGEPAESGENPAGLGESD